MAAFYKRYNLSLSLRACCSRGAGRAAIDRDDISYPPGPQQQTRRTLMQWANGTDRQTDGHRIATQTLLRILYWLAAWLAAFVARTKLTHVGPGYYLDG